MPARALRRPGGVDLAAGSAVRCRGKSSIPAPDIGRFQVTFINAGIPTLFLNAEELGFTGIELQEQINNQPEILSRLETIRAYGALKMGLISELKEAKTRQHTPKLAFVAPAQSYSCASGKLIKEQEIDLSVRAMSMGQLHHAMMGTAAVAIATAASIPNTLVNIAAGGKKCNTVTFGHPSGTMTVGAQTDCIEKEWIAKKAVMSRSARIIMSGMIHIPIS